MFATLESTCARKKFFENDLAVLDSVNADFGHFPALFRFLVRNVSIVLHDESIVSDERSPGIETMHLHRFRPPTTSTAHAFLAACFRRATAHAECFHAYNVVVVKLERFIPGLFSS